MSQTCATKEPFVLRVIGDSMLPDFEDGSIVVIDPEQAVQHGDYVVAQVDDQHQLGKLSVSGNVWQLATTSEEMQIPVVISRKSILGRVIKCTDPRRKSQMEFG